jgi:hypothetical protein
MPGPSQPGAQLAGAASGRQTQPHALRQALAEWQRPHDSSPPRQRWSKDTSSKSNERLEIGRFLIRKSSHSFRGLIAAVLPPFPGRHNNQSFLSRFDYGGAPFPGRLTKNAICVTA